MLDGSTWRNLGDWPLGGTGGPLLCSVASVPAGAFSHKSCYRLPPTSSFPAPLTSQPLSVPGIQCGCLSALPTGPGRGWSGPASPGPPGGCPARPILPVASCPPGAGHAPKAAGGSGHGPWSPARGEVRWGCFQAALGLKSQLSGFPWECQRKPSSWDRLGVAAREGVSAFSSFRDGRCYWDSQLLGPMVGDRALARGLFPALSGLCLGSPALEQDDL